MLLGSRLNDLSVHQLPGITGSAWMGVNRGRDLRWPEIRADDRAN